MRVCLQVADGITEHSQIWLEEMLQNPKTGSARPACSKPKMTPEEKKAVAYLQCAEQGVGQLMLNPQTSGQMKENESYRLKQRLSSAQSADVKISGWSTVLMAFLGLVSDKRAECSEDAVMAKWAPAYLWVDQLLLYLSGLEVPAKHL